MFKQTIQFTRKIIRYYFLIMAQKQKNKNAKRGLDKKRKV